LAKSYRPKSRIETPDQLGNALRFSFTNLDNRHVFDTGAIGGEQYTLAIRGPAQQLIVSRVCYQRNAIGAPVGPEQEDITLRMVA
jgi:hypothetical protein